LSCELGPVNNTFLADSHISSLSCEVGPADSNLLAASHISSLSYEVSPAETLQNVGTGEQDSIGCSCPRDELNVTSLMSLSDNLAERSSMEFGVSISTTESYLSDLNVASSLTCLAVDHLPDETNFESIDVNVLEGAFYVLDDVDEIAQVLNFLDESIGFDMTDSLVSLQNCVSPRCLSEGNLLTDNLEMSDAIRTTAENDGIVSVLHTEESLEAIESHADLVLFSAKPGLIQVSLSVTTRHGHLSTFENA